MASIQRLSRIITLSAAISAFMPAGAADVVVSIPSGWQVYQHWCSASADGRVAVILYPTEGDPVVDGTRIMIAGVTTPKYADLPGRIVSVTYSPAGTHLLAVHVDGSGQKTSLITSPLGTTAWTKADPREFSFSTNGNVVLAASLPEMVTGPGDGSVELFGLNGQSLRKFSNSRPLAGAVVPGDGTGVIFATKAGLIQAVDSVPSMHTQWSRSIGDTNKPFDRLRPLSSDRFLAVQYLGKFQVLRTDGSVVFIYDPETWGATSSQRNYASYVPYATPDPNVLLLFNGTFDGLLLNLTTGAITNKQIDLATPSGFKLIRNNIEQSKLVFYSATAIRIRTITY